MIITSKDENKQIMSVKHSVYDVRGVQFHPESILTPDGKKLATASEKGTVIRICDT